MDNFWPYLSLLMSLVAVVGAIVSIIYSCKARRKYDILRKELEEDGGVRQKLKDELLKLRGNNSPKPN